MDMKRKKIVKVINGDGFILSDIFKEEYMTKTKMKEHFSQFLDSHVEEVLEYHGLQYVHGSEDYVFDDKYQYELDITITRRYNYDNTEIEIISRIKRDETDEEFEKRVEKNRIAAEKRKKAKEAKKQKELEKERKLYESLKKKFEA